MGDQQGPKVAVVGVRDGTAVPSSKPAKFDSWWRRVLRELRAAPPAALDAAHIKQELDSINFGLRCLVITGILQEPGIGYKAKHQVDDAEYLLKIRKGLRETDEEIVSRSDWAVTMIMQVFMFIRAAEDVVVRHGLEEEYKAQIANLQEAIARLVPAPSREELSKLQAMLGKMMTGRVEEAVALGDAKGDGDGGVKLSDAGSAGQDSVGEAGLRGNLPTDPDR